MHGLFGFARANKENILYTVLTVFLLERVRRGWNRIDSRGRGANLSPGDVEKRQQTFMFRAALLYALPLVLPVVKYLYRSIDELSGYVGGLEVLGSVWAFAAIALAVEAFLAIVIYNLLGIYVERMNAALGFFRTIGRSVVDGSRVAVQAGGDAGVRAASRVRSAVREAAAAARGAVRDGRTTVSITAAAAGRTMGRLRRRLA